MGARILVVDDERPLRTLISAALRARGHSVQEAQNGREGLTILRSEPIDLVVADIVMPEMPGPEMVQQAWVFNADLRVILITGFCARDIPCEMLKRVLLLTKPFLPAALCDAVEVALGKPGGHAK
jgi:two-component system, cell cycle sensor histidine kinase and response regulator CckA